MTAQDFFLEKSVRTKPGNGRWCGDGDGAIEKPVECWQAGSAVRESGEEQCYEVSV